MFVNNAFAPGIESFAVLGDNRLLNAEVSITKPGTDRPISQAEMLIQERNMSGAAVIVLLSGEFDVQFGETP